FVQCDNLVVLLRSEGMTGYDELCIGAFVLQSRRNMSSMHQSDCHGLVSCILIRGYNQHVSLLSSFSQKPYALAEDIQCFFLFSYVRIAEEGRDVRDNSQPSSILI